MINDDFALLKSNIEDPELLAAVDNIQKLVLVADKLANSMTDSHESIARGHEGLESRYIYMQKKLLADYINLRGSGLM